MKKTMFVAGSVEDPRTCVCATLRKASRAVTQVFDNALRPSGLRATQFNILGVIWGSGEATVTQLTKRLAMDQTTLPRSLGLLERENLIQTVPKPDGRLRTVKLIPNGEQAIESAFPLWAEAQKRMVLAIGTEAWALLGADLDRLVRQTGEVF